MSPDPAGAPALVLCAHGTRDPDGRAAVRAVVDEVAALLPGVDVREAFVDVHGPFVADVVAGLPPATGGEGLSGVVVPLLLAGGYHVHVDIAEAVGSRADVVATPALGPDDRLVDGLLDRMRDAGAPEGAAVVLVPAGSSDERAQADSAEVARRLGKRWGGRVVLGFAAGPRPSVAEAVTAVRARSGGPVVAASYLLAPGWFQRAVLECGADVVTGPVLPDPRVAEIVGERYRTVVG